MAERWPETDGLGRGRVIGLPVTVAAFEKTGTAILAAAAAGRRGYVCVAATHLLSLAHGDPDLARVLEEAAIVTADGMPVHLTLKLKGHRESEKTSGPDLMPWLLERAESEGLAVYFFGGTAEEAAALEGAVKRRFPRLRAAGFEPAPGLALRPDLDPAVARRIEASGARIVFVGIGCPRQEWWMARHSPAIGAVLIGVGAAFNFLSGRASRAPVAMQRTGLEWLFRLCQDPRRLAGRYVLHNTRFAVFALIDVVGRWLGLGRR